MSTNTVYIDTNRQSELFLVESTEGSTPTVKVYVYANGDAVTFTSQHTCKFIYCVDREASEIVEVDGTVTDGSNVLDFEFDATKTAINGRFFASIIVYDVGANERVVQSDGCIVLERNPALDGATSLDTTTVINWDLYSFIGIPPYVFGTGVNNTSCGDSPYEVQTADFSETFVHDSACDFVFVLPQATTANIGQGYQFMNLRKDYIITLQCQDGDTIDDSPVNGRKFTVRNYSIPSSVAIKQITATKWITVWGDGAWDTGSGIVDFSSSSSSSSSSGA